MWLKLRWARFFTLAGWHWKLSPRPGFDFEVSFSCYHSECPSGHKLLVRVVDKCYDALRRKHGETFGSPYDEPNPALFGDGPENTFWTMVHGAGGGDAQVESCWTQVDANWLWERAARE